MTGGFRFAGLQAHIAFVEGTVVQPMRRAGEAGRPLDHLAYGLVGQGFAATATVAVTLASRAVRDLGDTASGFADGLRGTEEAYRAVEAHSAALLAGPR